MSETNGICSLGQLDPPQTLPLHLRYLRTTCNQASGAKWAYDALITTQHKERIRLQQLIHMSLQYHKETYQTY